MTKNKEARIGSLKFPSESKITGRSSTLRGAFIKAIIPTIGPNHPDFNLTDYHEGLNILKHTQGGTKCSYCGSRDASDLDHFRAIVKGKTASRYITDIYNLVPACGLCNQSKGGSHWKSWIQGKAANSPKNRNVPNLDEIISNLEAFEDWSNSKVNTLNPEFIESDEFNEYMQSCENLIASFYEFQRNAEILKSKALTELSKVNGIIF